MQIFLEKKTKNIILVKIYCRALIDLTKITLKNYSNRTFFTLHESLQMPFKSGKYNLSKIQMFQKKFKKSSLFGHKNVTHTRKSRLKSNFIKTR